MTRTTIIEQDCCPFCGSALDAATAVPDNADAAPEAGDVTVCISCAGVLIFDEALSVRRPTTVELMEAMSMPPLRQLLDTIRAMHRSRV
jgi:hypothetical protein